MPLLYRVVAEIDDDLGMVYLLQGRRLTVANRPQAASIALNWHAWQDTKEQSRSLLSYEEGFDFFFHQLGRNGGD